MLRYLSFLKESVTIFDNLENKHKLTHVHSGVLFNVEEITGKAYIASNL